jgi:hypothetical protein
MAYLLIDPPVSPLSPRGKIQEWLEELARWAEDPEYSDPKVRKQIQGAMAEARRWLAATQDISHASRRDLPLPTRKG